MKLTTRKVSLQEFYALNVGLTPSYFYHKKEWLETVSSGFGAQLIALVSEDVDGLVVSTPFMIIRKGPLIIAGSPLSGMYTEFLGPLFQVGVSVERMVAAINSQHFYLKKMGVSYIEWGMKFEDQAFLGAHLPILGYQFTPRGSLAVDLDRDIKLIWESFAGRARNMIRKSEKLGVLTEIITSNEVSIGKYYEMLLRTFAKRGMRPPHPLSFYLAVSKNFTNTDHLKYIIAKKDGNVIAAGLFLIFGERMMYFSGASTDIGDRLAANSLLQWTAIKYAIMNGVKEYDMGGTGNLKIDMFKKSFGGSPIIHGRWVYKTAISALAEKIYLFWLRFRRYK